MYIILSVLRNYCNIALTGFQGTTLGMNNTIIILSIDIRRSLGIHTSHNGNNTVDTSCTYQCVAIKYNAETTSQMFNARTCYNHL